MRRRTLRLLIILMVCPLMIGWTTACCSANVETPAPQAVHRVAPEQAGLATLVDSIDRDDYSLRWELAITALDVLLDVYHATLNDSAAERPSTGSRRAKLARWQVGTQGLVRRIESARLALLAGTGFDIYTDARKQILVLVEGQPIALTGLRSGDDRLIESTILQRFCAFSDCSAVQPATDATDSPPGVTAGHWRIRQGRPPAFEINGKLRCTFAAIDRRQEKAAACVRAAQEVTELASALMQLGRQAVSIDWPALAKQPPRLVGGAAALVLNERGDYLNWELPMLARLSDSDWRNLVTTLGTSLERRQGTKNALPSVAPVIEQGERLLPGPPAR